MVDAYTMFAPSDESGRLTTLETRSSEQLRVCTCCDFGVVHEFAYGFTQRVKPVGSKIETATIYPMLESD